jgi:glycine cleavage system H protein
VNGDPEGEGWFFKMKIADKNEFSKLMTQQQYEEFVKGL